MEKKKNEAVASETPTILKRPLKVFVVGGSLGYANWITDEVNLVNSVDDADLVLLTGGEDVNPKYYNEKPHPTTHFTQRDVEEFKIINESKSKQKPLYGTCRGLQILTVAAGGKLVQHQSNRYSPHLMDDVFTKESNSFKVENLLAISNFLTNLEYDFLFKDKKNLQTSSIIGDITRFLSKLKKIPLITTSAHHQAAYPYNLPKTDYQILAWTRGLHLMHENGDREELDMPEEIEIEAAYYPKIKAFGIQGHPEWMVNECANSILEFSQAINQIKNDYIALEKTFNLTTFDPDNSRTQIRELFRKADNFIASRITHSPNTNTALSYFKSYLYFYAGLTKVVNNKEIIIGSSLIRNVLISFIKSLIDYEALLLVRNELIFSSTSKFKSILKNGVFNENLDSLAEEILDQLITEMHDQMFPTKVTSTATSILAGTDKSSSITYLDVARGIGEILENRIGGDLFVARVGEPGIMIEQNEEPAQQNNDINF